jgi:hypothetical protein
MKCVLVLEPDMGPGAWNIERSPRPPFLPEIATDAIDDRVFARYLRIEYGFVDIAPRALGYAVAKAPSFVERRCLGLGLHGLVTDQAKFFVHACERMGAHGEERTGLPPQGWDFCCTRSSSRSPRRRVMRRSWPAFWRQSGCI